MSVLPPETNDDDAARLALVETELLRRTLAALRQVIDAYHRDARRLRELTRLDLTRISDEDRDRLRDLAWRWRRKLPRALAPKLPPHDPIVRQMEAAHGR